MSEFDLLVHTIVNPLSSVESRSQAERNLLELLSSLSTWSSHLNSLFTANDTICFFIGIGYQRLIWRHWYQLSSENRELLTNTLTNVLMTRSKMSIFAKSKLEQVVAAICINSLSLQPALSMIQQQQQQQQPSGDFNGLSVMKTTLEIILSDDPKIDPTTRLTLENLAEQVVLPLTNLSCTACMNALQSYNEENSSLMIVSLELLKIIVSRLTIGSHITVDVLNLLFTIAELGADHQSVFHQSSLASLEILTEIMIKKYIPRDTSSSSSGSSSSPLKNGNDRAVGMMMHIINKTVQLLQSFR
jgi:predicted transcriptional regulator YheO